MESSQRSRLNGVVSMESFQWSRLKGVVSMVSSQWSQRVVSMESSQGSPHNGFSQWSPHNRVLTMESSQWSPHNAVA